MPLKSINNCRECIHDYEWVNTDINNIKSLFYPHTNNGHLLINNIGVILYDQDLGISLPSDINSQANITNDALTPLLISEN